MISDRGCSRVDLTMLWDRVAHTICEAQQGIEKLRELGRVCDVAVQQRGNQAAWQYVDMISMEMMEISKLLASESHELHRWMQEADPADDWQKT